jgi:glutamate synthase (NADPH/NADH) large chain
MLELHREYTGSPVAAKILDEWPMSLQQFVKVMPTDYKRVLAERKRHDEEVEQKLTNGDETGTFVAQAR